MIDRWYHAPAPALRLATIRVLVGLFAVFYLVLNASVFVIPAFYPASRFAPVGVVALVLSNPLPPYVAIAGHVITVLLAVAFTLGFSHRFTGPAFGIALLWVTTYRQCFGMIFHTENLLVLHVFVLGLAASADTWSMDARGRTVPADSGRYGWPLRALMMVTVVAYVLAGVAKLHNSGLAWADGEILRTHIAWDNLRKIELGDMHAPLGAAMVPHAFLFRPLAWFTLLLELGAPLALLRPRIGWVWVFAIWSFHVAVVATMAISFVYPLSFVAFVAFFPIEKIVLHKRVRRILGPASRFLPG